MRAVTESPPQATWRQGPVLEHAMSQEPLKTDANEQSRQAEMVLNWQAADQPICEGLLSFANATAPALKDNNGRSAITERKNLRAGALHPLFNAD